MALKQNQIQTLKLRQQGQLEIPFNFDEKGHTVEPMEIENLSSFDKSLKTALDHNLKENK